MNLDPRKFFKQQPLGDDEDGGGGQGDSTADNSFSDTESDEAAVREGEALLEQEGDKLHLEDSDSQENEEQSEDDQDPTQEEEEEAPKPASREATFKDAKTGNWDWQKITKAVGPGLEKTFKETQAQISKVSQENKDLRGKMEHVPALSQRAQLMDHLDRVFHSNPEFRAAAMKALGVAPQGGSEQEFQLPEGVNPNDPLIPLIMRQQRMIDSFHNRLRSEDQNRQEQETKSTFLQGLKDARDQFSTLVGRPPTEEELRAVAEKMRSTRYFRGAEWVPSLFTKEIQEASKQSFRASLKEKRNLPSKGRTGAAPSKTQKSTDLREAFDASWSETME